MDRRKTVLILDDDSDMMTLMVSILGNDGYRTITAWDGRELFDLLKNERPDLILLDVMLPGIDGLSILSKLRENPSTSSIPVILVTARGSYTATLKGYQSGADGYIAKPFCKADLMNAVRLILEERGANVSSRGPLWLSFVP